MELEDKPGINARTLFLLILPPLAFIGLALGHFGLMDGNEVLYAEIAREMLESGEFIIPHLNGVPYLEKPPLFYWAIAASLHAFGPGETAVRLPSVLASAGLFGVVVWFGRKLGRPRLGLRAVYVLGTSVGFVILARTAMPDALFTALLSASLLAAYLGMESGSIRLRRSAFALLGLAVLTKGPLALFLFCLVLGVYWLLSGREERDSIGTLLLDPVAWLIFLLVAVPWFAAVSVQIPEFPGYYFLGEQVLRFSGLREPHDYYSGSPLYYLPRLVLFFFPWIGLVVFGWIVRKRGQDVSRAKLERYLWIGCLAPLVFFSVSSAKANYYHLVCLPPLALLVAHYYEAGTILTKRSWIAFTFSLTVFAAIALVAIRIWLAHSGGAEPALPVRDGTMYLVVAVVLTLSVLALYLIQVHRLRATAYLLGVLYLPIHLGLLHVAALNEAYISSRQAAAFISNRFPRHQVYLFRDYEALGGIPFYLRKAVPVIDNDSADLRFGVSLARHSPLYPEAAAVPGPEGRALFMVRNHLEASFRQAFSGATIEKIATIGRTSIFTIAR